MRLRFLHWLLPLVLLLSQQGMVWHGVGHLSEATAHATATATANAVASTAGAGPTHADLHADPQGDGSQVPCDLCLAFGDLLASARSEPLLWVPADHQHVQVAVYSSAALLAAPPQPRSRGPPFAL